MEKLKACLPLPMGTTEWNHMSCIGGCSPQSPCKVYATHCTWPLSKMKWTPLNHNMPWLLVNTLPKNQTEIILWFMSAAHVHVWIDSNPKIKTICDRSWTISQRIKHVSFLGSCQQLTSMYEIENKPSLKQLCNCLRNVTACSFLRTL